MAEAPLNPDFVDVLGCLLDAGVEFAVVGADLADLALLAARPPRPNSG